MRDMYLISIWLYSRTCNNTKHWLNQLNCLHFLARHVFHSSTTSKQTHTCILMGNTCCSYLKTDWWSKKHPTIKPFTQQSRCVREELERRSKVNNTWAGMKEETRNQESQSLFTSQGVKASLNSLWKWTETQASEWWGNFWRKKIHWKKKKRTNECDHVTCTSVIFKSWKRSAHLSGPPSCKKPVQEGCCCTRLICVVFSPSQVN